MKFSKEKVLGKLTTRLKEIQAEEAQDQTLYNTELREYERDHRKWKKDVVAWVAEQVQDGKAFNYNSPSKPMEPTKPVATESKQVARLISQIECVAGDEISISKSLLDGVTKYL